MSKNNPFDYMVTKILMLAQHSLARMSQSKFSEAEDGLHELRDLCIQYREEDPPENMVAIEIVHGHIERITSDMHMTVVVNGEDFISEWDEVAVQEQFDRVTYSEVDPVKPDPVEKVGFWERFRRSWGRPPKLEESATMVMEEF